MKKTKRATRTAVVKAVREFLYSGGKPVIGVQDPHQESALRMAFTPEELKHITFERPEDVEVGAGPTGFKPKPGDTVPDWSRECMNCQQRPILRITEMCGPCTFGEAATAGGNW